MMHSGGGAAAGASPFQVLLLVGLNCLTQVPSASGAAAGVQLL